MSLSKQHPKLVALTALAFLFAPAVGFAGDAAKGKDAYVANCTSCHNRDPSKVGSTGPAITGSSPALLEAKILRRSYPPGYVPKRKSTAMPEYLRLKQAIPHFAAYLQ